MNYRPTGWLLYVLLSFLTVPVLVYIFGRLLAGPYEGKFGLLGLMGNLFGDALLAKPGAWLILLAPLILVAIWWGSFALCRKLQGTARGAK
jgi:uncharacterized membrane protein